MTWKVGKVEERRFEFIQMVETGQYSMTECCRHFEISRKTGYKILKRFRSEGHKGLVDRSRAPHSQKSAIPDHIVEVLLELRTQFPTWGPRKIRAWLDLNYPGYVWPAPASIGRIYDRFGVTIKRRMRTRLAKTAPLAHCTKVNDVWCADFKGLWRTLDGSICEPFTLTDAHSRFLLRCAHLLRKDTGAVWGALSAAFREFGLPDRLRTDNGSPFATTSVGRLSPLAVKLIKAGVTPEWIEPGKPQQNPRHERFHQTLCRDVSSFPARTLNQEHIRIKHFVKIYNFERPHEALGQETPAMHYLPSPREWSGVLRSPEYPGDYLIRRVKPNGSIRLEGRELFVTHFLRGEPVGLQEREASWVVYYGPIELGKIIDGRLESRKIASTKEKRRIRNRTRGRRK